MLEKPTRSQRVRERKARVTGKEIAAGYIFVLPALLFFLVFQIYPLFRTVALSLMEYAGKSFRFVGLQNYRDLAANPVFLKSIINSTLFVVLNVPVIIVFALAISFFIYRKSTRSLGFYRIAFYLPSVASIVTICIVWKNMLNPIMGLINYLTGRMGIPPINWLGSNYALGTLSLILFSINVGMSIILYIAAMQGISHEITEAALIDGANKWTLFVRIIIPLVGPTTLFVIVINTINLFQSFALVNLMTKGGPFYSTTTIVFQLYETAFGLQKFGLASAMGICLGVIISLVSVFQFKIADRTTGS